MSTGDSRVMLYSLEPSLLGWRDDGEGLGDERFLFKRKEVLMMSSALISSRELSSDLAPRSFGYSWF